MERPFSQRKKSFVTRSKPRNFSRLPSLRFDGDWTYLGTSVNNGIPTYQYQASGEFPALHQRQDSRGNRQDTRSSENWNSRRPICAIKLPLM